jgi:hypothetical protein
VHGLTSRLSNEAETGEADQHHYSSLLLPGPASSRKFNAVSALDFIPLVLTGIFLQPF